MTVFMLDDMAEYLDANPANDLTSGSNLRVGLMPDQPDSTTAIFEYSGLPPTYLYGPRTLPAISNPSLQIICRDVSYVTARAQCFLITEELEAITNLTVNGNYYERVSRKQDPFFLKRDSVRFRVYFACNFDVSFEPS